MVRRHENSSFGDAYAFPGGVLDAADAAVHAYCRSLTDVDASARLGIENNGLDYYSAAVRELFEESGVLFADLANIDESLNLVREGLNAGTLTWDEFVKRNALQLHCDALHYFSHWVTPPTKDKRYTTRFFLAALPAGQEAVHCGGELTESCWARASDLLQSGRHGDIELHYPTIKTLESIARHETLMELVEWARGCVEWGITSMTPMIIERDGESEIVLPGHKHYPGTRS